MCTHEIIKRNKDVSERFAIKKEAYIKKMPDKKTGHKMEEIFFCNEKWLFFSPLLLQNIRKNKIKKKPLGMIVLGISISQNRLIPVFQQNLLLIA